MGKKQIFSLIVFLIILGGLVLRSINLRNIQFNWDQEYLLAFPAKDIIYNHHFPLIGARTGTGDLNIGPLYSYLAAMTFFVFRMDPIAAPILAMLLSYITIIFSLILVRRVFGPFAAGYFICLWCVSPFVISLDRIPWNVNLLPISSVLTACGLWLVMKKEKLLGWFLAGSGLLVGVNSHFSVCFFLVIVLTVSLINKKMVDKSIIWTVFILGLSLVPLILFNFRHNQLLKQNFTKFVVSAVISYNELPNRLIYISSITLETIGRVILFEGSSWIQQSLAIFFMVLLIIFRNDPKIKVYLRIFCIYLLIYILGFTLYKGPTPDYYYLGLVVVSTIGFALVFSKIKDKFPKTILLLLLICFILSYKSYILVGKPESYSLAVKQQIIETVKKYSDNQPVFLNLDMELGHSFGYDYLLDYYKIGKLAQLDQTRTFWVSYPENRFPTKADFLVGSAALGLPSTSQKIFNTRDIELFGDSFKVRVAKVWSVVNCSDKEYDKYLLSPDVTLSCVDLFHQKEAGVLIVKIPECSVTSVEKTELKDKVDFPLFLVSGKKLYNQVDRDMIVVMPQENLCIGFIDLVHAKVYPLSWYMEDIVYSFKNVYRY